MTSAYCGVCGRQYSECVCGSRPYPRSGLDSPVRVELIAVPRERLERLERVAVAAREWFAGGSQGSYNLRKALQDLDEAPGEKERGA